MEVHGIEREVSEPLLTSSFSFLSSFFFFLKVEYKLE